MNLDKSLLPLAQRAFHANTLLQSLDPTSSEPFSIAQTSGNIISSTQMVILASAGNVQRDNWRVLVDNPYPPQQAFANSTTTTTTAAEIGIARAVFFGELEETRTDTSEFLKVVGGLRTVKTMPEADALASRLEALLEDYQADYSLSLSVESLRTLIGFLSSNPDLKRPIITATPDGNLFGEWKSEGRYLGVQFLPNRHGRYVAIRPNPLYTQHRIRSSGVVTTDQLLFEIASHKITEWARRPA